MATNPRTVNTADLGSTHEVRRFVRDLERDVDSALVAVARGEFKGLSISLVSGKAELQQRLSDAARAHERRIATSEEARRVAVRV